MVNKKIINENLKKKGFRNNSVITSIQNFISSFKEQDIKESIDTKLTSAQKELDASVAKAEKEFIAKAEKAKAKYQAKKEKVVSDVYNKVIDDTIKINKIPLPELPKEVKEVKQEVIVEKKEENYVRDRLQNMNPNKFNKGHDGKPSEQKNDGFKKSFFD